MLRKIMTYQKNCLYDVGGGLIFLLMAGAPILLIVLVITAIVVAGILINKADNQKANLPEQKEKPQDYKQ